MDGTPSWGDEAALVDLVGSRQVLSDRRPWLPRPEVSGSPGTPVQYTLEDVDSTLRIRIGDPDRTITGRHDYTITYRVEGTLNGFPDHDELYWNAIGADWEVPIEQAAVTVSAPAPVGQVACHVGPVGSTRSCASSETDGRTGAFAATGLEPNEGVTVVVRFPTGAVPAPGPVLEERWSLARAFSATPGTLTMAGGSWWLCCWCLAGCSGSSAGSADRAPGRVGGRHHRGIGPARGDPPGPGRLAR